MTQTTVLQSIRNLLNERGFSFRELHHEPTRTSEESARARGEDLRIGGKAILTKGDGEYRLFVLPADCRIDSTEIRKMLGLRKLRFANQAELVRLTGLTPGSVPPFGHPILPFDLFVDSGIPQNVRIAFNAGSLTDSIVMHVVDYMAVARPKQVFSFASRDESLSGHGCELSETDCAPQDQEEQTSE